MRLYNEAEIRQMARRLVRLERENAAYRELYHALQMFINNPDGLWMSVVVAYDTARKALEGEAGDAGTDAPVRKRTDEPHCL